MTNDDSPRIPRDMPRHVGRLPRKERQRVRITFGPMIVVVTCLCTLGMVITAVITGRLERERAAATGYCVANLGTIKRAKRLYAEDYGWAGKLQLQPADLAPYMSLPGCICPEATATNRTFAMCYAINERGELPTCRINPRDHQVAVTDKGQ